MVGLHGSVGSSRVDRYVERLVNQDYIDRTDLEHHSSTSNGRQQFGRESLVQKLPPPSQKVARHTRHFSSLSITERNGPARTGRGGLRVKVGDLDEVRRLLQQDRRLLDMDNGSVAPRSGFREGSCGGGQVPGGTEGPAPPPGSGWVGRTRLAMLQVVTLLLTHGTDAAAASAVNGVTPLMLTTRMLWPCCWLTAAATSTIPLVMTPLDRRCIMSVNLGTRRR
jgi:hypothetical protein